MEIDRFAELTAYSLLRIVPYLLLFLYIFRGSFRLPQWAMLTIAALLSILRCLCGYAAYDRMDLLAQPNPGIMIFVVAAILLVRDHPGKSLFSIWMLANISAFTVTASKWLEGLIFGQMAVQLHRWTNLLTLMLVEIIVLIPLFFYIKYIYLKAVHQYTETRLWWLLWLVPFTFYSVWYRNRFFTVENAALLSVDHLYMFFCLLVNGGGILIYSLVVELINKHNENIRLREKEFVMTLQQTQYENLKDRIEEARTAKHDLRQHLHIISAYVKDQKYDELDAYISQYSQSVPESSTLIFCAHYEVNALLQYFSGLAKQHGIGFSVQMNLPADVCIGRDALTVLLGNLLENAVHACLSEKEAAISVRGMVDENGVFFKVLNTFTGKAAKMADDQYLSSKHKGLGIGLRSVKSIVDDYRGMMEICQENGLFIVSVLLNSKLETDPH